MMVSCSSELIPHHVSVTLFTLFIIGVLLVLHLLFLCGAGHYCSYSILSFKKKLILVALVDIVVSSSTLFGLLEYE